MSMAAGRRQTEHVTGLYYQYPITNSTIHRLDINRSISDDFFGGRLLTLSPHAYRSRQSSATNNEPGDHTYEHSRRISDTEIISSGCSQESLPKQAAEVAAAARFISQAEGTIHDTQAYSHTQSPTKPRLGSLTIVRDSFFNPPLTVAKSRPTKMHGNSPSKRKVSRPPPLQLRDVQDLAEAIQSPLPTRSSSKGAPSFDLARPLDSARSVDSSQSHMLSIKSPGLQSEPKTPLPTLALEDLKSFQFDFSTPVEAIPEEPRLSRSGSGATADSQSPPTPPLGPDEDQIRRNIEAFALEQGPYLRGSERRTRRPPNLSADDALQDWRLSPTSVPEKEKDTLSSSETDSVQQLYGQEDATPTISPPALRRKKSIFGWLQKKPEVEVDDLIDLYMTDEQREEEKPLRRPSRPKLTVFRNRTATDPLPLKAV